MNPVQLLMPVDTVAPAVLDSDTSVAAARSMDGHLGRLESEVLAEVFDCGARTCDEMEVSLELSHQTVSARIRRLVQLGKLMDSGLRRPTRSGRGATVWKVAP